MRLAVLGVKRVTLPRMLPAAAILGMRNALAALSQAMGSGENVERPDLLASIDDIWGLMGEAKLGDLEARYLEIERVNESSLAV